MVKTKEQENERLESVFHRLLPYYWHTSDNIPADIGLILALNQWFSVFHAVNDIASNLASGRQARRLQRDLNHVIAWKGIEPRD